VERFVDQPCAVVSGAPAWLLSRLLRSERVTKVLANPQTGVDQADLATVVDAIHRAGRAHENRLNQRQRDNATASGAVTAQSWSTKQAADHLGMSQRRVQELAGELGGARVGREWRIPEVAVREYQQRKVDRQREK
jgi:excisionase family DNA binding protein